MRGICWGKTIHSANDKLADIKLAYHLTGVKPKVEKKEINRTYIEFDNGDIWYSLVPSEHTRGYKANISYVDVNISANLVYTVIENTTTALPYNAIQYFIPSEEK